MSRIRRLFEEVLTVRRLIGALVFTGVFLTVFGLGLQVTQGTNLANYTPFGSSEPPNVIFVLADDLDTGSVEHMPAVQRELAGEGATFSNAFVTRSLCCPSRASILTGQYAHNHKVQTNNPPDGGFEKFQEMGHEGNTVADWLKEEDYQTVLIGKYLNGYGEEDLSYVPPGWDEWYGLIDRAPYYNYLLNENGQLKMYGSQPEHYQTDVLTNYATDYVRRAAEDGAEGEAEGDEDKPFFMYLAPKPPKGPFTPAPRHEGMFAEEEAPRPPSFNEEDTNDKPSWVDDQSRLTDEEVAEVDEEYRKRLRMLLSVDEMVSSLVETLRETGELDNTYIVFTSDNGYQLGEHRLFQDKQTAYEESIHVPLFVRGPGVPAGRVVDRFALNTDFAPTFTELGGTDRPDTVDGRSLVPLLTDAVPPESSAWRSAFLTEHWPEGRGQFPEFKALRTEQYKYVSYANGKREIYDLIADPYELENTNSSVDPDIEQLLEARLADLKNCAGETCRDAEDDS